MESVRGRVRGRVRGENDCRHQFRSLLRGGGGSPERFPLLPQIQALAPDICTICSSYYSLREGFPRHDHGTYLKLGGGR